MRISRREFLHLLGISAAVAGGASRIWAVPDSWRETLESGPRLETWGISTCGRCPAGCGIRVRLIDGIPVRITGNPISPVNNGYLCPMGEAGLELLYHPDRVVHPLKRTGGKGNRKWEPISWDEAMRQVVQALRKHRGGPAGRIGFLLGDRNTLVTELAREFTARMGSSLFFPVRPAGINELGIRQGTGEDLPLAFDLRRTDYLVTFGTNLLEEPFSPVYFNRLYGELKAKRPQTGLKMVHVDSRMSQAGRNATEWVRIRPGTMGVLALGMANILLRDRNFDREFVERHTRNFRNGPEDFHSMVTRDYFPDRVSEITGIPAPTILRLAREFGSAKAPLALTGGTSDFSETGMFTQWAVASLNALSGGFTVPGLWRDPGPLPRKPAARDAGGLPDPASGGNLPAPDVLLIAQANPVFRTATPEAWEKWLSGIPLVVQFATMRDDTSPFADLVLPVTTYLEQWDLTLPTANLPFSQMGLQQPIVSPMAETRSLGDLLLRLGEDAGVDLFPGGRGKSYREVVEARMKTVFASGKGTPYFEAVSLQFLEDLRKRGWQVYSYPAFADFWRLLREKGGWWDPGEYPTVTWSRKPPFRFPGDSDLSALLREPAASGANKRETAKPAERAAHREIEHRLRTPEGDHSFLLLPFPTLMNLTGDGASQPLLQEMFGLHPRLYWGSWGEIHPERAARLQLADGDRIRVVSGTRSAIVTVRVVPTVAPEVLAIPIGQGHRESGRHADGIGVNPLALLDPRTDPATGRESFHSTIVRVEKIAR
ncbi:MAG: hypothetical protein Kow00128_10020 [Deltaproteobacteria bacterium]